jgi:response regulator RpfG family c-di-GMP phosphodiesterase
MTTRILCVDDDLNILSGYQRALRRQFQIEVALGGEEGLTAVRDQGPYAVIVADMRMPGMDGIELLAKVREISPDTIRMMLTGNSDQQTAMKAVNKGQIFRFMTKPCSPEDFAGALQAGVYQYRLVTAERELLTKTLSGSVKMLTDVLSLVSPTSFGRSSRIREPVRKMAQVLGDDELWMIEIAAMLSQVGCVAIPEDVLARQCRGEELSRSEHDAFAAHPLVGQDLLKNIPRLEGVAEIIAYQEKRFNGAGTPPDERCGKAIPAGSRILKVALDYDSLTSKGCTPEIALSELQHRSGWYDPDVVAALQKALNVTGTHVIREVALDGLRDGAILAADLKSIQGTLLCAKGTEVTRVLRLRLRNYACNLGFRGPIKVYMPLDQANPSAPLLDREQAASGKTT